RWGCLSCATFPKVARSSQPWALSRNPVGIHFRNSRKAPGLGAAKKHNRQRSATEEQQRSKPNAAQPPRRQSFFALIALFAHHRPLTGMLVARAWSTGRISCRAGVDNSLSQYYTLYR